MIYQNLSQNLNSIESKIFIDFFIDFIYRLAQSPHKHQNLANQIHQNQPKSPNPALKHISLKAKSSGF